MIGTTLQCSSPRRSNVKKNGAKFRVFSKHNMLTLILCIAFVNDFVRAQDSSQAISHQALSDPAEAISQDTAEQNEVTSATGSKIILPSQANQLNQDQVLTAQQLQSKYGNGQLEIFLDSISPQGGPTTGSTQVLVRGGPYQDMGLLFPHPKCKFGSKHAVVDATYVTCTAKILEVWDVEGKKSSRDQFCIQCGSSPASDVEGIVPFSVSLTGDFTDSQESLSFEYYLPPKVSAIYPRYGVKDGGTMVEIWGENFKNFDQRLRCAFGSKTVQARFVSSSYLICISPPSDVVQKPIGFSVSLNNQQNSLERIDYWYYNQAILSEVLPNYGPDTGGNRIMFRGSNFAPFNPKTDIDNSNDTFCNFEQEGIKSPFFALNSTFGWCLAAPNVANIDMTTIDIALNNRDWTDDNIPYFYYKPPRISDIQPREGPTRGNTTVKIFGLDFKPGKTIVCHFGESKTQGKFISLTEVECVSPPAQTPGPVPLYISYKGDDDKFQSQQAEFLYFETPIITGISPICGPHTGYTQITVSGRNFIDMGYGKIKCIFNGTQMNATIIDNTTLKCDSPPLTDEQLSLQSSQDLLSQVQVTVNGREKTQEKVYFGYYPELQLQSISPNMGPIKGGTLSTLQIKGAFHQNVCNLSLRFGAIDVSPIIGPNSTIQVSTPIVGVPDSLTIFPSGNGQNFAPDYTLHFRDYENTFTYFQDIYVGQFKPVMGPATGGTNVLVSGFGFRQFKFDNGSLSSVPTLLQLVDANGNVIGQSQIVQKITDTSFTFQTPQAAPGTKAGIQISYNGQNWQTLSPSHGVSFFSFYDAPQISSIKPNLGPVKTANQVAIINGKNFACDKNDPTCSNLVVRFGDENQGTIIPGTLLSSTQIQVTVPQYVKPEVLQVEVSFNQEDFTRSNVTYNFFDPFILVLSPVLIPQAKSSLLNISGFGFVQADDQTVQVKFTTANNGEIACNGQSPCIVPGTFIDAKTVTCNTLPISMISYQNGTQVQQTEQIVVELSVVNNIFTNQKLSIRYYIDPTYTSVSRSNIPKNLNIPTLTDTDFHWENNDLTQFISHSNFTAKYTVGSETVITLCRMETVPLGSQYDVSNGQQTKPTHIACQTPNIHHKGKGTVSYSVNGQDYTQPFPYESTELLDVFRLLPQCGPLEGQNKVKLYGSGFGSQEYQVFSKFGVISTQQLIKEQVQTQAWNQNSWLSQQLMTNGDLDKFQHKEHKLSQNDLLSVIQVIVPAAILQSHTNGGPVYVSVGQQEIHNATNGTIDSYHFTNSLVEYYYYKQPIIKKVEPTSGLTNGGTPIQISGAWFDYKVEYGLIPYCMIGDKIVRAQFQSTVRIVCTTPPNDNTYQQLPIKISLNGVDFINTDFSYSYYQQSNIIGITPQSGQANTGTEIFLIGDHFSNITNPENVKCRWTLIDNQDSTIPRDHIREYTPAYYVNETMMMCVAPASFIGGDRVFIQLTFNNMDYSEQDERLIFSFYQVNGAFPHSGPSNSVNEVILIRGAGFKPKGSVFCSLNDTLIQALEVSTTLIKCPMTLPNKDPHATGAVQFGMQFDGSWTDFGEFFYYQQIELLDIQPKNGPDQGRGLIFMFGTKFRDDFPKAELGCKIGDSVGKSQLVDSTTMRCVVEQMDTVNEGEALPVQIALNSYSWVGGKQSRMLSSSDSLGYVPYGVVSIFPESGPVDGYTDIFVTGKGFTDSIASKAKCRFGVDGNYAIVDAEVLDYTKLVCRSPPADFKLGDEGSTVSVPFSISFNDPEMKPWTTDFHRFRYYKPAVNAFAVPDEIQIRKKAEIYVFAETGTEFNQPVPTGRIGRADYHGTGGVSCSFGIFGSSMGMFVNSSAVLCLTPNIPGTSDDYATELVTVGVAMNGQDSNEETSNAKVTFVGTGSSMVVWQFILKAIIIALILLGVFACCIGAYNAFKPTQRIKQQPEVLTVRSSDGTLPRGYNQGYNSYSRNSRQGRSMQSQL